MHLNPEQKQAVEHIEGPALVLAGAGSGKTRVVTYRIAHLLSLGVPASDILAVTFTNKAAGEMRERILRLSQQSVLASTFHSLCARILRESIEALGYKRDFVIFDEDDSEKVLKECLVSLHSQEDKGFLKSARLQISHAKNQLLEPDQIEDEFVASIYRLYQQKLKEYNALDFDDLLFLTVKLFQNFPDVLERYQKRWRFILIDEYQDTNLAQYTLIKFLAEKHQNVFAVGDPDQSIYSWRGADVHNILNFEKNFPGAKIIALEQNYRSRSNILAAANALIEENAGRYKKHLWSDRGEGEKIGLFLAKNEHEETAFVVERIKKHQRDQIALSECVIFYRTHFQSRTFEDALLRARIPYVIIGGLSFYQRKEIKDILALLRLVLGGADFLSFSRTINLPKRGLGEKALASLKNYAQERGRDIFSACKELVEKREGVKLSERQYLGLKSYVEMIDFLREISKHGSKLRDLVSYAIERSSYLEVLKEDPESYQERRENLEELVSKAAEWEEETENPSLAGFLEELTLKTSHDEKDGAPSDALRLMTLHNGKGLEFEVVFIVGMEEELFPHMSSFDSQEELEEERRLCYVGMTRAKDYLYLSASRYRYLWGVPRVMRPSRFLAEIPSEFLHPYHVQEREIEEAYEEGFVPGDQVFHHDFGQGIVEKSYHTSHGITYDVFFPQANTRRTLVAKYAKLIRSN